jgi:hypothetical protein
MSSSNLVCPKCQSTYFTQIVAFRKISALQSKSGKAELHAQPNYICVGCGGPMEAAIKAAEEEEASVDFGAKLGLRPVGAK